MLIKINQTDNLRLITADTKVCFISGREGYFTKKSTVGNGWHFDDSATNPWPC